jgi:hypothetical protein
VVWISVPRAKQIGGPEVWVLTVIVTVLFASEPSIFELPAASENLLLETLTTPLDVLFAVGVKMAL